MIDASLFREAMARLGAAVNLITTDGPAGRYGIIASALCSVSDSPPTLLLCINRSSRANAIIKANGVFCANVLMGHHSELSNAFARAKAEERFDLAQWAPMPSGAPALVGAAVALDCRVIRVSEVGSHSVFFAEVQQAEIGDGGEGLVYFNRTYYRLSPEAARACG